LGYSSLEKVPPYFHFRLQWELSKLSINLSRNTIQRALEGSPNEVYRCDEDEAKKKIYRVKFNNK
jgi:hypothetical protein